MKRTATLILILCLAIPATAAIRVTVSGAPDTLFIGDPMPLQVDIIAPPNGKILVPNFDAILEPFELQAKPDTALIATDTGIEHWRVNLLTTCYVSGDQVLQPIPVKWVSNDGVYADSAESEPHIVYVQGVVPASLFAIADSTSQKHHLLAPNRIQRLGYTFIEFLPWIIAGLAAIGVFFLIRWFLKRRKKQIEEVIVGPPPRPAHEIALEALDELRDRQVYQSGEIKLYYSELTEILRLYIESRYEVAAMESTSFQLLRDIDRYLRDENLKQVLETILSDADLAKFAKHRPDETTCQKDLQNGYIFINKTKPLRQIISEEAA